jgi:pimeloyl-ACP methyl ester carboxylesterase
VLAVATEFSVQHGGVTLSGEESGEGSPVLLLHGLTATRRYVVMGSKLLERSGHRVIQYDARAHGRSSPAPEPSAYNYELLTDDALAVLDDRGVERAVLAGASMGAHALLNLALRRPDRVAGIAVITPAYSGDEAKEQARLQRWDRLSEGLRSGGVDGFLEAFGVPDGTPAFARTVLTVLWRMRCPRFRAHVRLAHSPSSRRCPYRPWWWRPTTTPIPSTPRRSGSPTPRRSRTRA